MKKKVAITNHSTAFAAQDGHGGPMLTPEAGRNFDESDKRDEIIKDPTPREILGEADGPLDAADLVGSQGGKAGATGRVGNGKSGTTDGTVDGITGSRGDRPWSRTSNRPKSRAERRNNAPIFDRPSTPGGTVIPDSGKQNAAERPPSRLQNEAVIEEEEEVSGESAGPERSPRKLFETVEEEGLVDVDLGQPPPRPERTNIEIDPLDLVYNLNRVEVEEAFSYLLDPDAGGRHPLKVESENSKQKKKKSAVPQRKGRKQNKGEPSVSAKMLHSKMYNLKRLSMPECERLIAIGLQGRDKFTYDDFVQLLGYKPVHMPADYHFDAAEAAFRIYFTDEAEPFIFAEDMFEILTEMGFDVQMCDIENLLEWMDSDGDGKVGLEDFRTLYELPITDEGRTKPKTKRRVQKPVIVTKDQDPGRWTNPPKPRPGSPLAKSRPHEMYKNPKYLVEEEGFKMRESLTRTPPVLKSTVAEDNALRDNKILK